MDVGNNNIKDKRPLKSIYTRKEIEESIVAARKATHISNDTLHDNAMKLIESEPICGDEPDTFSYGINSTKLSNALERDSQSNYQEVAQCYLTTALRRDDEEEISNIVHDSFKNMKVIGQPSSFGTVALADINGLKNKVVVKTPTQYDEATLETLLNEYIIGAYGAKLLRKVIPNFSIVYAKYLCSGMEFDENGNIIGYCNGSHSHDKSYINVIYERVMNEDGSGSRTLEEFLKINKDESLKSDLYLQLFLLLAVGQEVIGFCHNDLHSGNILVKELKQKMSIKYPVGGKNYYINTKYILVLIDYGLARMVYKRVEYGINNVKSDIRLADVGDTVTDITYFVSGEGYTALVKNDRKDITYNNDVLALIVKDMNILEFADDLHRSHKARQIPPSTKYRFDIVTFINKFSNKFGPTASVSPLYPLYKCINCGSFDNLVDGIKRVEISTISQLYDFVVHSGMEITSLNLVHDRIENIVRDHSSKLITLSKSSPTIQKLNTSLSPDPRDIITNLYFFQGYVSMAKYLNDFYKILDEIISYMKLVKLGLTGSIDVKPLVKSSFEFLDAIHETLDINKKYLSTNNSLLAISYINKITKGTNPVPNNNFMNKVITNKRRFNITKLIAYPIFDCSNCYERKNSI